MRTALKTALATAMAFGLAGCLSGEPGEADILQALQGNGQFMMILSMSAGPRASDTAAQDMMRNAKIRKSECVRPADRPGYVCDFQVGRTVFGNTNYGPPMRGRFFKTDTGWAVELG